MPAEISPKATKYAALADLLREQIAQGSLRPGDRLPSIGEMRSRHEASLATVDRALSILEKEGLVIRVNGSGTFVAQPATEPAGEASRPLIGLILPGCDSQFFSRIIEGVEKESRATGYNLLVANSYGDHTLEAQLLRQIGAQTVGLLVMACSTGNQSAFATLLERRTPFVLLDRKVEGLRVSTVATDNERGGYLATRHLLDARCDRIYAVGEASGRASSLRERVAGFRKALSEADMPFDGSLLRQADDDPTRVGYRMTKELLNTLPSLSERGRIGIFALNEYCARGCYMAIKECGLRIPHDVAVVGFDDTIAHFFDPPLSTVHQDLPAMGREGVRLLLELIRTGSAVKPRQTRLQPQLMVRNSSDSESSFCSITQVMQAPARPEPALVPLVPLAGNSTPARPLPVI